MECICSIIRSTMLITYQWMADYLRREGENVYHNSRKC